LISGSHIGRTPIDSNKFLTKQPMVTFYVKIPIDKLINLCYTRTRSLYR